MRIPPFWAKAKYEGIDRRGKPHTFFASAWSFTSLQEAKKEAAAKAKRIFDLITTGHQPGRYEYLDRPIREEILQEVSDGGSPVAIITRNRYGAAVLNCRSVMFVDVDYPRPGSAGAWDALCTAFSRKRREKKQRASAEETVRQVETWSGLHPEHGFRLYRTKEGLRLLFTGKEYEPTSEETLSILSGLQADPLYVKLTRKQECFRARLTAKPWRCGVPRPPCDYPWENARAEARFQEWEAAYRKRDSAFKVCELIGEFGPQARLPAVRKIIDIHDRGTRIKAKAPLA